MDQSPQPISKTERVARERVEKAKAAMLKNLCDALTLAELADIAGCSAPYLSRTFTRVEGVTMVQWLASMRMNRAGDLLATGECNVTEASRRVGYSSNAHFSRAFTKHKGVMPSRWVEHCVSQHGKKAN